MRKLKNERDILLGQIRQLDKDYASGSISKTDYRLVRLRYEQRVGEVYDAFRKCGLPEDRIRNEMERNPIPPMLENRPERVEDDAPRKDSGFGWLFPRNMKDLRTGVVYGSLGILLAIAIVMAMCYPYSLLSAINAALDPRGLFASGGWWLFVLFLWWGLAPFVSGLAAGTIAGGAWAGLFTCLVIPSGLIVITGLLSVSDYSNSAVNLAMNGAIGVSVGAIGGALSSRLREILYGRDLEWALERKKFSKKRKK